MLQCHKQQTEETNYDNMIDSLDHNIKCRDWICNEVDRLIYPSALSLMSQPKVLLTIVESRCFVSPRSRYHSRLGWFGS